MARIDKEIMGKLDTYYDEEQDAMERWASAVEEGLRENPKKKAVYDYVKKRITAISGYSAAFFQEKALEKLIDTLYKKAGSPKLEEIDDQMIIDLINYISDLNPKYYDVETSHLNTYKR